MSDTPTPSSSTEKTVTVTNAQLGRLWTFTYISLGLNVVILAAFLVGAIMHHHGPDPRRGFGDRDGGYGMERGWRGPGFHHFGGMGQGWGRPGGFGGQCPMSMGGGPGMRGGWGGDLGMMGGGPGMWSRNPGMMGGGGPGMRDMMGGEKQGPPDPATMTDKVLSKLSSQLNLTDDEKAKIKPLVLDTATQIQKAMEAQRTANQKAMAETKAKIKALLTPDQQKQLDAMPLPGEKPPGDAATDPAGE
jgi:hypothetical protein